MSLENSVREAMSEPWDLEGVLRNELIQLWDDLDTARRNAINGVWSIQCDNIVYRITLLTHNGGGVVEWGEVSVDLLIDGTYQRVYDAMNPWLETPQVDMDRVYETYKAIYGYDYEEQA